MGLKLDREIIADGVGFTEITDPKLRTSVLKIKFVTELSGETAQLNSIVSQLIPSSNSRIKTYSEMSDRLDALYGSSLYSDTSKNGDCQTITVSADCIDNRFAFDSEDILGELLDIINDCIFSPNTDENGFDKTEFELKRRELIESIYSDINNKRWYAMLRAQRHIFKGEPGEYSVYGTVENAEKITPRQAYDAYLWLLKTAVIEIYFVSPVTDHSAKERFRKMFSGMEREVQNVRFRSVSPLKAEVCRVTEKVKMKQTKVIMAFKSATDSKYAATVMARLFGGTPFSKLFSNVREKMSLCYYCAASYVFSKGTMFVESGVETENTEKLISEVQNQLDSIKNGGFTDEEFENTVRYLINLVNGVEDSPGSVVTWYFSGRCSSDEVSPEEYIRRLEKLTREDIIAAARSFSLDTVYVMEADADSEEDDDE
ncbi:pitrilysin family protein [Ruminococcus sp. HUN007]|uniref:EF-P 5-aminopentanol modification-associated protein YfmF n=1 Tax=Ruminococcus sp. HUN007 TaxID=1514668 RepID=UPI0006799207|nr:pitrilysin family protein [Ruminococcus sp. HUN007]